MCSYGVSGFCRKSRKIDMEDCESHSSDDNGNVSDSQSMPDDNAIASDSQSMPDDNAIASNSEGMPDDIHTTASDSESVQDDYGTVSGSESNGIASNSVSIQEFDTDSNVHDDNCQRSRVHSQQSTVNMIKTKLNKKILYLQITIMQSNDTPFLSDELVLDVGIDENVQETDKILNPWGDMNVNDIPLDIETDTDTDSSTKSEPITVKTEKPPDVVFSPLSISEHLNSAKRFYIKLRPSEHTIHFKGTDLVFKHRSVATIAAKHVTTFMLD